MISTKARIAHIATKRRQALTRSAERLLRQLAEPGRYAVTDPTDEAFVILRCARDGVSLGGGRFTLAAARELRRRDLVGESAAGTRRSFRISEAGLARLRREDALAGHAFAAQHLELAEERIELDGRKQAVTMNAAESPLDWLRRRKGADGEPLIDAACHEAGERLRRDLTFAAMLPRVTANWSAEAAADKARGAPRDPAAATDLAVAARQRATRALDAVGGDFADLLIDLCGFLKGFEQIERERSWPARSGKVVARLALARLADHYGLARAAQGPHRSRAIRAWREACAPELVQ